MAIVSMKQLLECGVHFGHQTRRWNPKMKPFIFTERNGVYIIDLQKTVKGLEKAYDFLREVSSGGGSVLFIGTKRQAQETVRDEALRSGGYYVNQRWLGGMLTNFQTIKKSIDRLNSYYTRKEKGDLEKLSKKEQLMLEREAEKLEYSLGGIKNMGRVPGCVFLIDPHHEEIAKKEAKKLGIPVVALIDTNRDPDGIDYLIAGNDDAIRSIQYFTRLIAEAAIEGGKRREAALREQAAKQDKERAERPKTAAADREQRIGAKGRAWVGRKEEKVELPASEAEQFAKAKVEEGEGTVERKPE